jgi:hypothetical protein
MPTEVPCAAACRTGADNVNKSAPTSEPLAAIAESVRFMMFPSGRRAMAQDVEN